MGHGSRPKLVQPEEQKARWYEALRAVQKKRGLTALPTTASPTWSAWHTSAAWPDAGIQSAFPAAHARSSSSAKPEQGPKPTVILSCMQNIQHSLVPVAMMHRAPPCGQARIAVTMVIPVIIITITAIITGRRGAAPDCFGGAAAAPTPTILLFHGHYCCSCCCSCYCYLTAAAGAAAAAAATATASSTDSLDYNINIAWYSPKPFSTRM